MKKRVFAYADNFNMDTALYDSQRRFHNIYRRRNPQEADAKIKYLINGDMMHSSSHYTAGPFIHYDTGELLIGSCEGPERRGRCTFQGFDFTVISTTNDNLGAIAMKHMRMECEPKLKITKTMLSMSANGSTAAQTLIIDHNTQLVHSLDGCEYDNTKTQDGVLLGEHWKKVPEWVRDRRPTAYCLAPGKPFFTKGAIDLAYRGPMFEKYDDIHAACLAWHAMEGRPSLDTFAGVSGINLNTPYEYVVRKGFADLLPIERAKIALGGKAVVRDILKVYALNFDNEGFFKEVESKITK